LEQHLEEDGKVSSRARYDREAETERCLVVVLPEIDPAADVVVAPVRR
jgi:hypothetical protein